MHTPHPEPKPWHNPKRGEVWILTIDGEEIPHIYGSVVYGREVFFGDGGEDGDVYSPTNPYITDGRRIWPITADDLLQAIETIRAAHPKYIKEN